MLQNVSFEDLRSLAFGSITSSYVAVGTPTLYPARIICLTNKTDKDMTFSINGTSDQLIVPAGSFKLFDFNTNRQAQDQSFQLPARTQFYVKQVAAPGSGSVYIEVVYGS